ncbi:hypothetical protein Y032_0018g3571 [Ancylostoma ceylanicum]|uniref:Uncharacterized protein n=1 Tax=Ancylostoma ceylanicum TaxID=53326 RepID=A0A016V320_9BILA|nr:hypothetical protein Y032_0018g3571 [Ancylostoma ceylanicum]
MTTAARLHRALQLSCIVIVATIRVFCRSFLVGESSFRGLQLVGKRIQDADPIFGNDFLPPLVASSASLLLKKEDLEEIPLSLPDPLALRRCRGAAGRRRCAIVSDAVHDDFFKAYVQQTPNGRRKGARPHVGFFFGQRHRGFLQAGSGCLPLPAAQNSSTTQQTTRAIMHSTLRLCLRRPRAVPPFDYGRLKFTVGFLLLPLVMCEALIDEAELWVEFVICF